MAATATKPRPVVKTRPRPAAKPRPRPAAKPRGRAAAAKPRASRAAAKPRASRTAAKTRASRASAAARPKARTAAPQRARTAARPRGAVASAGNVALFPVAAVGGLADSGLVTRITRGRLWIVLLGVLLGGIVAINVTGLGMSASSSATEARIDKIQSDNGVLRARLAQLLSTEEIQAKAAALGLAIPAPDAIDYLAHQDSDFAKAAKRLAAGDVTTGDPAVHAGEADESLTDPAAAAAATGTTDLAVATDPATTTTATTEPIIDPNTGLPAVDPATGAPITAVDPVTGEGIVAP